MKLKFITGICISISVSTISCNNQNKNRPDRSPNVILIYLDDMGYGDITLTGASGYKTPNIDQMSKEGMFFSHYYSLRRFVVHHEQVY